jgi:hypothetical protein
VKKLGRFGRLSRKDGVGMPSIPPSSTSFSRQAPGSSIPLIFLCAAE